MADNTDNFLNQIKYDQQGLVGVIIQDAENDQVLMFAFSNREALSKTLETGTVHFWSRSRQKLWMKGETSGHTQLLVEAKIDCDADCILLKVRQSSGACHVGYRSCFYRRWNGEAFEIDGIKVFDPEKVY